MNAERRTVVPVRLQTTMTWLHASFWAMALSLIILVGVAWESWLRDVAYLLLGLVLAARVVVYVCLWRLMRGIGRSAIAWVGLCIATWPIGDTIAYGLLWTAPKEWSGGS